MRTFIVAMSVALGISTAWAGEPNKEPAKVAPKEVAKVAPAVTAKAEVKDVSGKKVGTVTLEQTPNGLLLSAELTGLPPGLHAYHVHEVGKCEAPFKSAGGHFNPAGKEHGMKNHKGMHAGDMPNFEVWKTGEAKFQYLVPGLTLDPGANSVLDADGSSIVIHAGVDDYTTNPAGNAGDRIACGVIAK